jgi:MFS family permease
MYLVSVVTFGVSGLMFAAAANPRLPWFSQAAGVLRHDRPPRGRTTAGDLRRLVHAVAGVRARLALVALVTTNFVMAGIMAVAPVDLTVGGHTLSSVGAIIALHVAGMFAVSPLSGHLSDRFGPATVVAAGAALLLAASVAGLFVHGTVSMTGHLIVLGVGWNLGIVGGSALLTDAVPDSLRPHVEGVGEVLMGLSAAVAAPVAAVVAVLGGYPALALVSGVVAVGVLVFMHMTSLRRLA